MKYKHLVCFLVIVSTFGVTHLMAQDKRPIKEKPAPNDKRAKLKESIYWGGNLGLQLSNFGSLVDISPNAGYKLNKYISGGIQIIYTNIGYRNGNFRYTYMFYGGGVFARIRPLDWLFLQAEYDVLSVPDNFSISNSKKRTIADVPLAGLGFASKMGENSSYYFLLMYEFAPTPNSPYTYGPFQSPLIYRVGFNVNF